MKRLIVFAIVMTMLSILGLAACGGAGEDGDAVAPNPAEGSTWGKMEWGKGKWG